MSLTLALYFAAPPLFMISVFLYVLFTEGEPKTE